MTKLSEVAGAHWVIVQRAFGDSAKISIRALGAAYAEAPVAVGEYDPQHGMSWRVVGWNKITNPTEFTELASALQAGLRTAQELFA